MTAIRTRLFLPALAIVFLVAGCTTPVAIDPATGQDQKAEYRINTFYAPIDAAPKPIFRTAIKELDEMGYFRTGELHQDNSISIFARSVGDEKVKVKIVQVAPGKSEVRIRVGTLGDLPESQKIYARIRKAI